MSLNIVVKYLMFLNFHSNLMNPNYHLNPTFLNFR
jgi:hypothetical protein